MKPLSTSCVKGRLLVQRSSARSSKELKKSTRIFGETYTGNELSAELDFNSVWGLLKRHKLSNRIHLKLNY
jgi:hypothetical protein